MLAGGERADDEAYLIAPTVFEGVRDDAFLSCEEVFGPVTSLYRFGDARRGARARERGRVRALGRDLHVEPRDGAPLPERGAGGAAARQLADGGRRGARAVRRDQVQRLRPARAGPRRDGVLHRDGHDLRRSLRRCACRASRAGLSDVSTTTSAALMPTSTQSTAVNPPRRVADRAEHERREGGERVAGAEHHPREGRHLGGPVGGVERQRHRQREERPDRAPSSSRPEPAGAGDEHDAEQRDELERRGADEPGRAASPAVGEPGDRRARRDLTRVQDGEQRAGGASRSSRARRTCRAARRSARSTSDDMRKNAATSRQASGFATAGAAAAHRRAVRRSCASARARDRRAASTTAEHEQRRAPAVERVRERHGDAAATVAPT